MQETNPPDFKSKVRMALGNKIEEYIVELFQNGSLFGLTYLGTQIPIGGSDPVKVDGYLDALVQDKAGNKYVVEVKSRWGWGATFFSRDRDPGESYLAQIGYYLRDLSQKNVTNQGMLLFVLIGDDTFGEMIAMKCKYDEQTDTVTAYESESTEDENPRPHNYSLKLTPILEKLKAVEGYVQRNELPPVDKLYKYPLTPENLAAARDSDIKKAVEGSKVIGDFEISYSSYKRLHMELQGGQLGYTEEEMQLLAAEHSVRETRKRAASNAKRAATIAAKKKAG